ncbi:MAG: Spy/CpxP family protein refolding chaperone [Vicinamibacterales bacterium]|nr:Spy/CpxP family protein refolding chaperone [Vicinamibacterales bacterium]
MMRLTTRTMLSAGLALALAAGVTGASVAAQGGGPGRGQGQGQGQRMTQPGGPGGPGMRGPGGPGRRGPGLPLARLGLNDAQREEVRGIMGTHEAAFRAVGERMGAARRALDEAVNGDAFNEALVRQRAADLAAIEADAAVLRAQVHRDVFGVLTPEQQQKARDLRADADKRQQERADQRKERRQGR